MSIFYTILYISLISACSRLSETYEVGVTGNGTAYKLACKGVFRFA